MGVPSAVFECRTDSQHAESVDTSDRIVAGRGGRGRDEAQVHQTWATPVVGHLDDEGQQQDREHHGLAAVHDELKRALR
jgi:hypothetical protein